MARQTESTPLPRPAGVESTWQEKVERAKEARREGNEIRKDKAPAFPIQRREIRAS